MTMHLVGPYMTTTNYKKRKNKKLTNSQHQKLEQSWKEHNKQMRRMHLHDMQFEKLEDYIAYTRGQFKPKTSTQKQEIPHLRPVESYRRETKHIPSLSNGIGVATKKEPQKYTGTLIKGIATMHKSNAVPIINEQQAIDIATMRRN